MRIGKMKRKSIFVFLLFFMLLIGCVKKDNNPPYIKIEIDGQEGNDGWYISNLTISLFSIDNESKVEETKYRINGGLWMDYVMPFKITKDGFYLIEYYAKDKNGNEIYKNISIRIDKTKPSINFLNFEPGYIYFWGHKFITPRIPRDTIIIGIYNIKVDAKDGLSGLKKVEFYLGDALAFEDDSVPYEWEIKGQTGIYNITAVAYDIAGNTNSICIEDVQIFSFG